MKTTVYILLFTCMGALCSSILQSCTKKTEDTDYDCDNTVQQYYLSLSEKTKIPYSGHDTLTMANNTGDTIHCIGGGKIAFTTSELQRYANPACGNHGIEKYYEAYKIVFTDSVKKVSIELNHFKRIFYPYGFNRVWDPNIVLITFKSANFFIPDHHISDNEIPSYIGNVILNGVQYEGVTNVLKNYDDSTSNILLNDEIGILEINLKPTETWTLLK